MMSKMTRLVLAAVLVAAIGAGQNFPKCNLKNAIKIS